jgi:hypothetical protein
MMANKQHDCGYNNFFALFAPDGKNAWGLFILQQGVDSAPTHTWFGNPSPDIQAALLKGAGAAALGA